MHKDSFSYLKDDLVKSTGFIGLNDTFVSNKMRRKWL